MPLVRRLLPALWALLTIGIVAGVVWAGLRQIKPPQAVVDENYPAPTSGPALVKPGHDYYVVVKLVEFNPKKPNGGNWDSGSAPDPKVRLNWHGQQVFELPTRADQFIAAWDLFRVNVMDIVRSGGSVDVASSINAPIIRIEAGEKLGIEVRDSDVISDDIAAKVSLQLDELHDGVNEIPPPPGSGIQRLVVQMIDRETPMSELVHLAGKR